MLILLFTYICGKGNDMYVKRMSVYYQPIFYSGENVILFAKRLCLIAYGELSQWIECGCSVYMDTYWFESVLYIIIVRH